MWSISTVYNKLGNKQKEKYWENLAIKNGYKPKYTAKAPNYYVCKSYIKPGHGYVDEYCGGSGYGGNGYVGTRTRSGFWLECFIDDCRKIVSTQNPLLSGNFDPKKRNKKMLATCKIEKNG